MHQHQRTENRSWGATFGFLAAAAAVSGLIAIAQRAGDRAYRAGYQDGWQEARNPSRDLPASSLPVLEGPDRTR